MQIQHSNPELVVKRAVFLAYSKAPNETDESLEHNEDEVWKLVEGKPDRRGVIISVNYISDRDVDMHLSYTDTAIHSGHPRTRRYVDEAIAQLGEQP